MWGSFYGFLTLLLLQHMGLVWCGAFENGVRRACSRTLRSRLLSFLCCTLGRTAQNNSLLPSGVSSF
uniref:Putative secreted protein n=1 Tax=Anopheles darlingi TaxID=43151 RepID=A0A2M4DIA1_ANODA